MRPVALPSGVAWRPEDPRTPRTMLSASTTTSLTLRVTVRASVDRVVVTGPAPEFRELAAKPGGPTELEFEIPRARVPEGARHLVICCYANDGNFGAAQALLF